MTGLLSSATLAAGSAGLGAGISGIGGMGGLLDNAKAQETERRFSALIDGIRSGIDEDDASSSSTSLGGALSKNLSQSGLQDPRLPGDFISSLAKKDITPIDKDSPLVGAAANAGQKGKIDRSSKIYEQALELESYFVKIMLSSMKNTIQKTGIDGKESFASGMYNDMFYDELARTVTKSAGFGLADQVYLQLTRS